MATKARGRPKKDRPAPPKRKPRAKQGYLDPDMAPRTDADIDVAAEEYVSARDARMAMLRTEKDKNDFLMKLMKLKGFEEYEYDGRLVKVDHNDKVSVRKVKDPDAVDSGEGESNGDGEE